MAWSGGATAHILSATVYDHADDGLQPPSLGSHRPSLRLSAQLQTHHRTRYSSGVRTWLAGELALAVPK